MGIPTGKWREYFISLQVGILLGFFCHQTFILTCQAARVRLDVPPRAPIHGPHNLIPRFKIPRGNLSFYQNPQWEILYYLKYGILPFPPSETKAKAKDHPRFVTKLEMIKNILEKHPNAFRKEFGELPPPSPENNFEGIPTDKFIYHGLDPDDPGPDLLLPPYDDATLNELVEELSTDGILPQELTFPPPFTLPIMGPPSRSNVPISNHPQDRFFKDDLDKPKKSTSRRDTKKQENTKISSKDLESDDEEPYNFLNDPRQSFYDKNPIISLRNFLKEHESTFYRYPKRSSASSSAVPTPKHSLNRDLNPTPWIIPPFSDMEEQDVKLYGFLNDPRQSYYDENPVLALRNFLYEHDPNWVRSKNIKSIENPQSRSTGSGLKTLRSSTDTNVPGSSGGAGGDRPPGRKFQTQGW